MSKLSLKNAVIVVVSIVVVLMVWWQPYFSRGSMPFSEWGYGLIWGDWLSDRLYLVEKLTIHEWNPNNVLGVNYIGRDSFNNPLSLGNVFKPFFSDPKAEWVFGLFFYLVILGIGTYQFLRNQGISRNLALLGAVLITIYPKWMDDIHHGPGKFVTAYSMVPWVLLTIGKMFDRPPRLIHFICLGIFGAIIFLGSGAWVSIYLSYLIVPYFIYHLWKYFCEKSERRLSDGVKITGGVFLTCALALGLSAYLLFPLWDNIQLSSRSLYAQPAGYGFLDLIGTFFPWVGRLYTMGLYDIPLPLPGIGVVANIRAYFGILAIPLFVYLIIKPDLRRKYFFFWMWPLVTALLFSKLGNLVFPLARWFEEFLGAQSSEGFLFFNYIFCINLIIVVMLDSIYGERRKIDEKENHQTIMPPIVLKVVFVLMSIYGAAIFCWLTIAVLIHCFPQLFNGLSTLSIFTDAKGLRNYIGFQFLIYSYFYDYFFYLILGSFVVRFFILWWIWSRKFLKPHYGLIVLALFMAGDFILITKIVYPFTSSLDLRYSDKLEQNRFVRESVNVHERIASHHISAKVPFKVKRFEKIIQDKSGEKRIWDPPAYFNDFKNDNPDNGFFEPLFDLGLSYYPVTVGKQIYNYHESLLPDYFFDFDKALNGKYPSYSRQSWNAVWDPESPLLDIAGISYMFWYEPLTNKKYELMGRYPIGDGYIYKNLKAIPKAYLVSSLEYYPDRKDLLSRMQDKSFDAHNVAVTEDAELANRYEVKSTDIKGTPINGAVNIVQYEANKLVFEIDAPQKSVLVVTDLFFPHWTAKVDKEMSTIYRVNCVFRGVVVEKGRHRVTMEFYNKPFHKGLRVSMFTGAVVIFLVVFLLIHQYKQRRRVIH